MLLQKAMADRGEGTSSEVTVPPWAEKQEEV